MGKQGSRSTIVYLPLVFLATFLVVGVPMLLVFQLRTSGVVTSVWAGTVIGVVASFVASYAGGRFWKTRDDSRDILFSDLMLWGWVQRWRSERRLVAAADLLELTTGGPQAISGGTLTNEQKARLLTRLTSGLEARDPYTHGHSRRVARHAANIAKRMGLSRQEVVKVRAAGAMHDVGKVDTPTAVLHKEGRLTDEQYAIVKRHPVDGAVMVSTLADDELTAMVRHHHERLDGTGYPDRLAGDEIPVGARILAVADTFDAVTSTRPYRHANAHKKALDILVAEAGTQLDPDAVRAFCSCYSGRRPLAYWTILANARPRLTAWLGGGLGTANSVTATNFMAGAATAAAVGAGAVAPLLGVSIEPPRALADSGQSEATAQPRSRPQSPGSETFRRMPSDSKRSPHPSDRPGRENASGQENARGQDKQAGHSQSRKNGTQAGGNGAGQAPETSKGEDKPKDTGQGQDKSDTKGKDKSDTNNDKGPATGPAQGKDKGRGGGQAPDKGHGQGKGDKAKAAGKQGKGK